MSVARLLRPLRRATARLGWTSDPTRAAVAAATRWLDHEGLAAFRACSAPGLAVRVRFADGPEVARDWGRAAADRPLGPDARFQVLSLSKPATALLTLALADDRVVDLDAPLQHGGPFRLPPARTGGFPTDGITLRRLLSHTAGFGLLGFGWCPPGEVPDARALLAADDDPARTLRLLGPPGAAVRYAGAGYAWVQATIEAATGRAFAEVARTHLLARAGAHATGFPTDLADLPTLCTRHDAAGRPFPPAVPCSPAASGLVTTASDLATLFTLPMAGPGGAPEGHGVLSPAAVEAFLTPQGVAADGAVAGLGVYLKARRGDLAFAHAGFDLGGCGYALGLRARRVAVVVLCNGDAGRAAVPAIAHGLRHVLYDAAL